MKKLISLCILFSMAAILMGAPARREPITLTQPDGTKIQAMLWGDEFMSMYTELATGQCIIEDEATHIWRPMTDVEVKEATIQWNDSRRKAMAANVRYKIGGAPTQGMVHMPVLLVQFSDLKFSEHYGSVAYFDSVFNQKDYDRIAFTSSKGTEYHTSSVRNYFNTQSLGKFDFQADIIGPVTLDSSYIYYGKDNGNSKDVNFSKFLSESIQKALAAGYLQNAAQYDGDKNGNVDFLYIVYAGWGQNENGIKDYIWAKNSYPSIRTTDGTYINNVSSSCELRSINTSSGMQLSETPDGIGVLVHEFSHALGLPDFYPVHSDGSSLNQRYGMDAWSVMDQGNYSGLGQIPNCYTAHERLTLGWIADADLDTVPAVGRDTLPPFVTSGKAMILRNPANANEYITLENHFYGDNLWERCWGNSSMFTYTTNYGMLVTHVDYDASKWNSNSVNDNSLHQYCNPLPADGKLWAYETLTSQEEFTQWKLDYRADIFPGYNNVDTLNGSNPKAVWYTGDKMAINITKLRVLSDGSLELTFGDYKEPVNIESIAATPSHSPRKIMTREKRITVNGYDLLGRKVK